MILQALCEYYDRLASDPGVDIAPFGFSRQNVSFCITINEDGSLHAIDDMRHDSDGRLIPQAIIVCGNAKPSGSGINPCFLWDNSSYLLGFKVDDPKPERTIKAFHASVGAHVKHEQSIGDAGYSAVCRFLDSWDPTSVLDRVGMTEILSAFGVFRIRGADHFVHERPAISTWWSQSMEAETSGGSQCLITGRVKPVARLHEPKIKGVWGGQSSGAALASFNLDAFESYGKAQGDNAPVSEQAAFQYCTALNYLLRRESVQRIQVGDTATVFWTDRPDESVQFFKYVFDPPMEDGPFRDQIHGILARIAAGEESPELGDRETRFYILGLSPNAARLSVRFWMVETMGTIEHRLMQHFSDLAIGGWPAGRPLPALWQILSETARVSKDIPPLLGGAVFRSIISGAPYPQLLLSSLIRRIRADREIKAVRVGVIKAYVNRLKRFQQTSREEVSVSLDKTRSDPAYRLGRLFAELEKAQQDAIHGIDATIRDRYYSAASATPSVVFPRLIRLNQHHLGKLTPGSRIYRDKRIQEIVSAMTDFPSQLNLVDQGLFAIGYYHQKLDIYTSKDAAEPARED